MHFQWSTELIKELDEPKIVYLTKNIENLSGLTQQTHVTFVREIDEEIS